MKKVLLVFLSLGLAAAMMAGCGSDGSSSTNSIASDPTISSDVTSDLPQNSSLESEGMESTSSSELSSASQSSTVSSSVSSAASSRPASSAASSKPASSGASSTPASSKPASSAVASQPPVASATPQQICKSIAAAYGNNYLPDGEMPTEHIYGLFSVDSTLVESVYGETSMISINPDMVIVMKAASGKASQLEAEMQKARDQYVETAMVYPKDTAKLHASKVVRSGDYVAFIMLGAIDETNDDVDSSAAQKFAQEQIQIGVKAFQNAAKS